MSYEKTVKELIDEAIVKAQTRFSSLGADGKVEGGLREISVAITKLEEAQMWYTRGLAIAQDKFNPADLEADNG
jgi:hypothetical protein